MIYDLSKSNEFSDAFDKLSELHKSDALIELKKTKPHRTTLQNRSLHAFFTIIANELNEMGKEFTYTGLNVESVSTMYTPQIVKDFFGDLFKLHCLILKALET